MIERLNIILLYLNTQATYIQNLDLLPRFKVLI